MRLGFTRFIKIFLSSLFIQTSWSFITMQGMGFLYSLLTGAKEEQKNKIMNAHKGFFNTHPYMSSYIIGATVRAYDEKKSPPENLDRFLTIAQASFASAGDLLFWQTIRPALLILTVILAIKIGIIGPILFILLYNVFHIYHRAKGINDGYNMGTNVIYLLKAKRFTNVQRIFDILGAFLSGALLSLIVVKTQYLLLAPVAGLFLILLIKRLSSVLIVVAILLLIIIMVMV